MFPRCAANVNRTLPAPTALFRCLMHVSEPPSATTRYCQGRLPQPGAPNALPLPLSISCGQRRVCTRMKRRRADEPDASDFGVRPSEFNPYPSPVAPRSQKRSALLTLNGNHTLDAFLGLPPRPVPLFAAETVAGTQHAEQPETFVCARCGCTNGDKYGTLPCRACNRIMCAACSLQRDLRCLDC